MARQRSWLDRGVIAVRGSSSSQTQARMPITPARSLGGSTEPSLGSRVYSLGPSTRPVASSGMPKMGSSSDRTSFVDGNVDPKGCICRTAREGFSFQSGSTGCLQSCKKCVDGLMVFEWIIEVLLIVLVVFEKRTERI
jgi:hypothetical protein